MRQETKITSDGIRKVLKNYTYTTAFVEYLWNGFDAKATEIDIAYKANELGAIEYVTIQDNGTGIDIASLANKFEKFYDSEKAVKAVKIKSSKHSSVMHGKNGIGRLTFYLFAHNAEWLTTYLDKNNVLKGGKIIIDASSLKSYNSFSIEPPFLVQGTKVIFTNISILESVFHQEIVPYLIREFAWFLELNQGQASIKLNGELLNYDFLIEENELLNIDSEGNDFYVKYIRWADGLNKEQSRYYYLDGWGKEVYKDFTSLNRQGDKFYHSIYVQSEFFNDFRWIEEQGESLFGATNTKSGKVFKSLLSQLSSFLRAKKRPLLRAHGEELVESFEASGILPSYKNQWEVIRLNELKGVLVGLYEVQPKIFINLNIEQKKVFVRFLNLLLDSNEREKVFSVLDDITNLTSVELEDLATILKSTTLSRIVSTLNLIQERYKVYYQLKELVFNSDLKANEIYHLQKMIEAHYWIFGEQYSLISAAEPTFEDALRRQVHYLQKEYKEEGLEHPYKLMQMDIFMCRQERLLDKIHNVVVELKHPYINLGEKQLAQVRKYMNVISRTDEFNAANMSWDFILVGNGFNNIGEIENAKGHGERSLVYKAGNVKIYVKTWSEIFTEFEIRHQFIDVKLNLERANLLSQGKSANDIAYNAIDSPAAGAGEYTLTE
ncbi:MAG: ATP-binding protein [Janthinobacterium lividum]